MKALELAKQNIEKGIAPRLRKYRRGDYLLLNPGSGKWAIINDEEAKELDELFMRKELGESWRAKYQLIGGAFTS